MTTSIIETVSTTTPTIPFTDVWDRDLLIVAIKLVSESGSAGVTAPAGWNDWFYTGIESVSWVMPFHADELSYTFTVTGTTSMQLLGLHLRSDLETGGNANATRSAGLGETLTTIGTEDALIGYTFVRDGPIDLLTPDFVLIDQTSHVAFWRHEPLQVPVGTSVFVDAYWNTPAGVDAWARWMGGGPPVVPAAGGWTAWVVD